jgi:hypothetical protein
MSVEQLEATLLKLPPADRAAFASWFDAHRHELVGGADDISPAVHDELALRLKEIDEHPENLEPFEKEDVERMIQEAADAHAKKSSTRRR